MPEPAPDSVSRYENITSLGQGGMARVLLTISRGPAGVNKLLVVKELKEEFKDDPDFVTMFMDEARIAACLNHPNVIQTYEVSSDGAYPLIVMEYLEGQPLNLLLSRVGRTAVPLDLHISILAQVATGLHYAHELKGLDGSPLNVIHRDVSPHNVFITYDGQVKLLDFGIAKAADSAGRTRVGQFKGKLSYAAPEQVSGAANAIDRRADIFALGVMLWEALAEQRLTRGERDGFVLKRRLDGGDPSIKSVVPEVDEELARICDKAMAFDPDERYATAAEFRAALDDYLGPSRRVDGEHVGALVRKHFAADRVRIKSLIEERIRATTVGGGTLTTGMSVGRTGAPSRATSLSQEPAPGPQDSTMQAANTTASAFLLTPAPARGRTGLLVAGSVLVFGVVFAAVQLFGGPETVHTPEGQATASAPSMIELSIAAEPAEAQIFLDDAALTGNPFRASLPKSSTARRLRTIANGFTTDERLITMDRDVHLELALKHASQDAPASVKAAPAYRAAAPVRSLARPAPAAVDPPKAPAAVDPPKAPAAVDPPKAPAAVDPPKAPAIASAAAPGEALTNPTRKKARSIDDTF